MWKLNFFFFENLMPELLYPLLHISGNRAGYRIPRLDIMFLKDFEGTVPFVFCLSACFSPQHAVENFKFILITYLLHMTCFFPTR